MRRHIDHEGRAESAGPLFDLAAQATARRDEGMAQVQRAANNREPGWEDQALEQLRVFARTRSHFAAEDFREAFPVPDGINPKALGPVLKRAQRERIVEPDGFVLVNCSNRSPRTNWRSLVFDGVSA